MDSSVLLPTVLLASTILVTAGCTSTAVNMPAPLVYEANRSQLAPDPSIEILYATDRAQQENPQGELVYGSDRHAAVAYGSVALAFDPDAYRKTRKLRPEVVTREELGRFPATPYPFSITDNRVVVDKDVVEDVATHRDAFSTLVRAKLDDRGPREAIVFVHGFNNGFDVAASTLAALWYHSDRHGVPILYSWPASAGGLRGYFIDRESGEFTIFHLKEMLRTLFAIDELSAIHIIAHSRGTDVVTSALRELLIEARGAGEDPRKAFRIKNLILAAPDLDFGVIRQRLMAEAFGSAFERITVYTAASDKALSISQLLMKGVRFGLLGSSDVGVRESRIFKSVGNVDFVRVEHVSSFVGHAYYYEDPAVSSDLIRLIREGAPAGSPRRPLQVDRDNFYTLKRGYLRGPARP